MDGIHLIAKAREKELEEKAWDLYKQKYALMDEKSYIPFTEWYKPQQPQEEQSTEEILKEVKNTLDVFKGRWTE